MHFKGGWLARLTSGILLFSQNPDQFFTFPPYPILQRPCHHQVFGPETSSLKLNSGNKVELQKSLLGADTALNSVNT